MQTTRRSEKPTFIGLFCGCGGFDLGLETVGFRSLAAHDVDADAVRVYNSNLSGNATVADLTNGLPSTSQLKPDVVVAGPPCQGFSTLGKQQQNDPRNSLLLTAVNLAISLHPKAIMLENVAGVTHSRHRRYLDEASVLLQNAGYNCRHFHLKATCFGLPQIRRRVLLVATKKNSHKIECPKGADIRGVGSCLQSIDGLPNHSPRWLAPGTPEFTIAGRISPSQKLCNVRGGSRAVATWQIPEVFGDVTPYEQSILESLRHLRRAIRRRVTGDSDPVSLTDLKSVHPEVTCELVDSLVSRSYLRRMGCHVDLTHTFNGKFRRLAWDKPSPAVDTRFGQPRYFLHPKESRGFSVREAARLQGFPDSFIFSGSLSTQFRHVGNAVPPPIGAWFGKELLTKVL